MLNKHTAVTNWWVIFLNTYHVLLLVYWLLRVIFQGAFWWLALLDTFALFWLLPLAITLPTASILRSWRTVGFASVLLLVGGIWFAPPIRQAPGISGETLRVVTYNTLYNNPQLEDDMRYLLTLSADVIVLQEIVRPGYDERLAPLLRYYPHEAKIENGIRIYSRYPYQDVGTLRLEGDVDEGIRRDALRVVVDYNGQSVAVYGVHLSLPVGEQHRVSLRSTHPLAAIAQMYDERRRNAQIGALAQYVERETLPTIVGGDFNLSHTSIAHNVLERVGLRDAHLTAGQGYGMTWMAPPVPLPPMIRIDYIWYSRASLRAVQTQRGAQLGSDHRPVIADFEVR